jgi:DnaJ-class molecular chaperone
MQLIELACGVCVCECAGDHFVTIKVDIPTSVSSSDRELLLKLKQGATAGKGFFSK